MSTMSLEERGAILEQELLALKRQLPKPAGVPWWEQISGVFADTPALMRWLLLAVSIAHRNFHRSVSNERNCRT